MTLSKEEVQTHLDKVRPQLQADGGDIELVEVKEDKIYVRLQGHCRGCAMSQYTLKMGIEQYLRKQLGNELEVISVD
ncbi:MAG: NifU family protein [Candidatus Lokiarchaeota archaeon]|nr:NifU family protein [Candidatus Lokiarchaeota archaeon]